MNTPLSNYSELFIGAFFILYVYVSRYRITDRISIKLSHVYYSLIATDVLAYKA